MASMNDIDMIIERYPKDILEHAKRVAKLASKYGEDYELLGLLHDILEDTDTQPYELPEYIRDDCMTLTRDDNETYMEYIDRVKNGSKRAITIKLCDLEDHFNNKETLKESLKERYLKAKEILRFDG